MDHDVVTLQDEGGGDVGFDFSPFTLVSFFLGSSDYYVPETRKNCFRENIVQVIFWFENFFFFCVGHYNKALGISVIL